MEVGEVELKIGAHVSVAGGYEKGIAAGKELGCETVQLFTSSPRRWAFRKYKPGEPERFRAAREASNITPVFSHANYLINVASPEGELREKSKVALLEELARVETLGMEFVVLHPGSYKDVDAATPGEAVEVGVANVVDALTWVFDQRPDGTGRILVENTAGHGNLLGKDFEEIRRVLDGIPAEYKDRVGACFDTCHAFASGYDFTTPEKYEAVVGELDDVVGLDRVLAFHLNDSREALGSHRDLHEHIGKGKIGLEPFGYFLNDPRFSDTPGVLETHFGKDYAEHRENLRVLFSLRSANND
ncbi:MAG: deoxyribonuclease IV [Promethearchaeota archaeon]